MEKKNIDSGGEIMKKPIGMLHEEKIRLERILTEMSKVDTSDASDQWEDLLGEMQQDISDIESALEAINEYVKNYY